MSYSHLSQLPQQQLNRQNSNFNKENIDIEGTGTLIVEDLLQGTQEWGQTPDIVRLTIKALTDVVKQQSESIRELEKTMVSRASKTELSTGLQLKANINDVSRTIEEVSQHLDQKLSFEDSKILLKDYILKQDVSYLLSTKVTLDEVNQLMEQQISNDEIISEIGQQQAKFDELQNSVEQFQNQFVQIKDFENLCLQVEQKADLNEVNDALEQKANKQSIQNALHRKANRADIEILLAQKADISDIQNLLENNKFQENNKQQINQSQDDQENQNNNDILFEKVLQMMEAKADKSDQQLIIESLNQKIDKHEFQEQLNEIQELKQDLEKKQMELNIRQQIQNENKSNNTFENEQTQQQFVDDELIRKQIGQFKNEIYQQMNSLRDDLSYQFKLLEDNVNNKQQGNNQFFEKLNQDIVKTNEHILQVSEEFQKLQSSEGFSVQHSRQKSAADANTRQDIYRLQEEIQNYKLQIEEMIIKKVDKKDFIDMKSKIAQQLEQKVELVEVQAALNTCQQDITNRIVQIQQQFKGQIKNVEQDTQQLIQQYTEEKADIQLVDKLNKEKLGQKEYNSLIKAIESLNEQQQNVVSTLDFEQHIANIKKSTDLIQKDLLLKANIKDVCTLLDTKSKIEDVNNALVEIHKELDLKPNLDDLNTIAKEQTIINESLCTENIVGRWTWKTGEIRQGNLVPWENQVVNTLPDNFLWEKNKTSILVVAPGLYEIAAAFFMKRNGNAQIFVNGESVFETFGTPNFNKNYNPTKKTMPKKGSGGSCTVIKDTGSHSQGNLTGISIKDFIVLPSRSRISVTFEGDLGVEGFIGLKRL